MLAHASDTPSSAHLFFVSLFATHTQYLAILFPFFTTLKRVVESIHEEVGAVVIGVGTGGGVIGFGVGGGAVGGVGVAVGVGVGAEVGGMTQTSLAYTSVAPPSPLQPLTAS